MQQSVAFKFSKKCATAEIENDIPEHGKGKQSKQNLMTVNKQENSNRR